MNNPEEHTKLDQYLERLMKKQDEIDEKAKNAQIYRDYNVKLLGLLKIMVCHPKQTRSLGDPGIDETPGGKHFTAGVLRVISRKDHRMTTGAFECVVVIGLVHIINRGRMAKPPVDGYQADDVFSCRRRP